MAKAYANRVWMTTATAGTGTITLGSAKAGYLTFAEAGVADTNTVTYVLIDGSDFEIGTGTYTSAGTTMSRDTVTVSKIAGVAGTTKLTLSGSAEVFLSHRAAETAFLDIANTFTQNQGLTSTDAGATEGPVLNLFRNSASPAASDVMGALTFTGKDDGGNTFEYARVYAVSASVVDGSERGQFTLGVAGSGTPSAFEFKMDGSGWIELNYSNPSANVSPIFYLTRFSSSPAAADKLGAFDFYGNTTTSALEYARIVATIIDPTHATADGGLEFYGVNGGTLTKKMALLDDAVSQFYSSDAGAAAGPVVDLFRDSASPAASDVIGQIKFTGRDSAANAQDYAAINGIITDPTTTTEDADIVFQTTAAGTLAERFRMASHGGLGIGGATYGSAGDCLTSNGSAAPSWNPAPLRGHIWGLTMSNNGTDAANDIDVAAGAATDEGHAYVMVLAASITKRLDAAWAVGSGNGGLNTGAEANSTWYEVHLIRRPDTGVVDVMFTTTANRATLPANYTQQRRIGWIRNDGAGAILPFTQVDDYFTLTTQINDAAATITASAAAIALTCPPSSVVRFRATAQITALTAGAVTGIVFSEIVEGNVTPALTTGILSLAMSEGDGTGTANDSGAAGYFELQASSTSTIEWDGIVGAGSAGEVFDVSTFGWIDSRRRLSAT